jgi:limonene-1,2-epoxide hydrolase
MVIMKSSYQEALTNAVVVPSVAPGSPEEKAGIERFKDFFADLSEERIRSKIRYVYAEDVYFNDTLKEIRGIDALEPYLLESAAAVESCTVDIGDVAVNNGNYYFRWTMDIRFRSIKKGKLTRSIGISHIRFNKEGKICLHQDYWDSTSGFFQHVPFVGYLIRKIKARF